ncbi:MAG: ATP binding [Cirrosporium novae-zelandiae]|nr:MAG: ATP binding [Cirrosporium novae-zelandiae]
MAMLASKPLQPAPLATGSSQGSTAQYSLASSARRGPLMELSNHGTYASPTESEFSENYDGPDSVRNWDEKRVSEWLRGIHLSQYEQLFKANNFTGDTLLEIDQNILKEMGVKKIGDRLRIATSISQLRKQATGNRKKRNRDSFAALSSSAYTPSSSDSPRTQYASRERSQAAGLPRQRYSRQIEPSMLQSYSFVPNRSNSRPSSPPIDSEVRSLRAQRFGGMSPAESSRREQGSGYHSHPSSANSTNGRRPGTPADLQSVRNAIHQRQTPSVDGSTIGTLPPNSPIIRFVYTGGQTKSINIKHCKSAEEVILTVLKKLNLTDANHRNYCFWVLNGFEPDPLMCHRLSDGELFRVCNDFTRSERNRLILRKVHAGEPDGDELQRASQIAMEEDKQSREKALKSNVRSQAKLQKLTGEAMGNSRNPASSLSAPRLPTSPDSITSSERARNINSTVEDLERADSPRLKRGATKLRQFFGQRPPSEMITSELTSFFPTEKKEDLEKLRMSLRRSARLSRAFSMVSNSSMTSSLKDAPPMPNIADMWLSGEAAMAQPQPRLSRLLSHRSGLSQSTYRESIASSALQPLAEETLEPNRKSYVSFDSDSNSANVTVSDVDGNTVPKTYFDDSNDELKDNIAQVLEQDGEGEDDELNQFLKGDPWGNIKFMRGQLIGQGSFGSVFLALHSITGELMAVKQVDVPNKSMDPELDKKKTTMVTALKREIDLLRDLQHPNIVQYLGTSCDDEHLNIFLEYVPGGSIAGMLLQYNTFQEPLIRNFVRQILDGLSYLHGRDIIHRDIKGANVLVDNKGKVKISDFGISKRVEASTLLNSAAHGGGAAGHANRPSLQGSVYWMAPEVVKQTSYTRKADIWSLGCLIVEMFSGTHPFPNCSQLQAIFAIGSSAKPTTPEHASDEARVFLDQTFQADYEKRPSADELLLSPFLKQMT